MSSYSLHTLADLEEEYKISLDYSPKTPKKSNLCCRILQLDKESITGRNSCGSFCKDFLRHIVRGLDTNLSEDLISPDESDFLDSQGIYDERIQNYLVWRRSSIYTIAIPITIYMILTIVNQLIDQKQWSALSVTEPALYDSMYPIFTLLKVVNWLAIGIFFFAVVIAMFSLKYWYRFKVSRRLVAISWSLYFFAPFIISFFPYRYFSPTPDYSDLLSEGNISKLIGYSENFISEGNCTAAAVTACCCEFSSASNATIQACFQEDVCTNMGGSCIPASLETCGMNIFQLSSAVWQSTVGLYLGVYFFLDLSPAAFTLPIVIIRVCMNVRSIVPQDPLPAYIAAVTPFIFAPLGWIAFLLFYQSVGNSFLYVSLLLFFLSPFLFVCCFPYMAAPLSNHTAHKYAIRLRFTYIFFIMIAALCFVAYLVSFKFSGKLVSELLTPLRLVEYLAAFSTEYFYSNVFIADVFVSVWAWNRKKDAQLSFELKQEKEDRLDTLMNLLE